MDDNKCQTRVVVANDHNPTPVVQPELIFGEG